MKLKLTDNQLIGSYFYEKYRKPILIKGEIDDYGNFTLKEFDQMGEETGVFIGSFITDSYISGYWKKPDGSKKFKFLFTSSGKGIPISRGIRVIRKTIEGDTEFTYPQITGMKNIALQSRINKSLKNKIFPEKLIEFKRDTDSLSVIKEYYSYIKFKVYYNRNKLLSIAIYSEYISYRPIPQIEPYNIDIEKGKLIKITDIFEEDALIKIDSIVKEKLKEEYKEEILECAHTLEDVISDTNVSRDTKFYIKKDKLVIIVPLLGSVSCYIEVEIPWKDVVYLISPNSTLKRFP